MGSETLISLKDQIKPFITIEFLQQISDWNLKREDWHKYKTIPAKQCTESDICKGRPCNDEQIRLFKVWNGMPIICPDIT